MHPTSMKTSPAFSFAAVARAARAALQWRLLLLWVLLMLIPTAMLATPVWQLLGANLDHSVHAADIAHRIDATVFADLMAAHGKAGEGINHAGVMALIATLLISPLLSGMAATAARATGSAAFRELAAGAVAEYPRMFRMQVFSLILLGLALALGGAAMEAAEKHSARAISAADASLPGLLALIASVMLFAFAHATLDAGRAALAIERRRTSAVKAWCSGCKLLLRRPLATMGVYLAISAVGLGLAAALAVGRINVAGVNLAGFIAALVLVQLSVAVIGWMRSARLFALIELARSERT